MAGTGSGEGSHCATVLIRYLESVHTLIAPEGPLEKETGILALEFQSFPLAFAVCIYCLWPSLLYIRCLLLGEVKRMSSTALPNP